jgi:muramoyltetrapeptide carboxypeptidase
MQVVYPPFLKPGDRLKVIAPSGNLRSKVEFDQGVAIWRSQGYELDISPQCDLTTGYLAGKDSDRCNALQEAWADPQCRGIICARGGYGSARILENWDPKGLDLSSPKWLIGFSDVTALLWSLGKAGVASIHGPVLTTLSSEPDWSIKRLFSLIKGEKVPPLQGKGWGGKKVTGTLLPGNLTVATHLLNTPHQPPFNDVILALEEVNEAPYRIDRLLTYWRMLGKLQQVKAIALGRFSGCEVSPNISSWETMEVLRDRLEDLGIPIVSDLPFGHGGANAALIVGDRVELDSDRGLVTT